MRCKLCSSYAINPHIKEIGREPGVDLDLCDVCYWKTRAERNQPIDTVKVYRRHGFHNASNGSWYATSEAAFLRLCDDPDRFTAGITCHGQTAERGRWYAVAL